MKTTNIQTTRQQKFLLVLPLVVIPCLTLVFWAFGGGRPEKQLNTNDPRTGMTLPGALFEQKAPQDKLSFYNRERADSLKKEQQRRADPYGKGDTTVHTSPTPASDDLFSFHQPGNFTAPQGYNAPADPAGNAAQIDKRLTQLQKVLNKPAEPQPPVGTTTTLNAPPGMQVQAMPEDSEMKQMNAMLEKILDIQHPDRVRQAIAAEEVKAPVKKFRAIPAEIEGTQKIVQGTVVRIRLLDSVTIGGQFFQKGQLIFGSGTLANQRYTMPIKSIHVGNDFFPVDLTVFDAADGMEGISVPEAITSDALRQGAVNGVQSMDVMSFDPSMSAQLATAGINTVKNAFGKKVKQVKAKIRDKHALLIRDNKSWKN